jgi:hypothetical protein
VKGLRLLSSRMEARVPPLMKTIVGRTASEMDGRPLNEKTESSAGSVLFGAHQPQPNRRQRERQADVAGAGLQVDC